MGCVPSQPQERVVDVKAETRSQDMDREFEKEADVAMKVLKLLLLGTGESGKSTIFKQMQILYSQEGFNDNEKAAYRAVARKNVIESLHTLINGCAKFGLQIREGPALEAAKHVMKLDPLSRDFWSADVVDDVHLLWGKDGNADPAIKATFQQRSRLQLPDGAIYLFDNIDRIGHVDYTPTAEDILRVRQRTSGIMEREFKIHGVDFKFLDVGGQRNERRKWIHCFEDVTAVMYLAAISEYDQLLYEDEKANRMLESIKVFGDICNNQFFHNVSMILFLNKIDLFHEKIDKVPLTFCFPEFKAEQQPGTDEYENECKNYIRSKFVDVRKRKDKDIYVHFTQATDTQNVEQVFDDCRKIILKENLRRLGLG